MGVLTKGTPSICSGCERGMLRLFLLCCCEAAGVDNVRRSGECPRLLTGGVGGMSPVKRTSVSIYLHSILRAATGERTKMSNSSGVVPSSGKGDPMEGTTPGSSAGFGLAGGSEVASDVFISPCAASGEPDGEPIVEPVERNARYLGKPRGYVYGM